MRDADVLYEKKELNGDIKTEMFLAFREFLKAIAPYLKITAEIIIKNISKTVMLKVIKFIKEENAANDEKIFEGYREIMQGYSDAVKIYSERVENIKDTKIKEILGGVSEILAAELRQFEEYMAQKLSEDIKNPIEAEKEQILKSVLEGVLRALDIVKENIFSPHGYFDYCELKRICFLCADKNETESHLDTLTHIYQRVIVKGGLDIYKSYSGAVVECDTCMNSLDARKEARYFYEGFKQELDNMESIVKLQLSALKDYTASGEHFDIDGAEAVESFSERIKGTMERARSVFDEIGETQDISLRAQKKPALMNYDDFLSFIEEKGLCAHTDKVRSEGIQAGIAPIVFEWREKLNQFLSRFDIFLEGLGDIKPDVKPYKRFLYEMRVEATDKLLLTDGIISGFDELHSFYIENREDFSERLPEEYLRIIDGIHESVGIKLEMLKESKKDFLDSFNEKLESLCAPEFSEQDIKNVKERRLLIWLDGMIDIDVYSDDCELEAARRVLQIIPALDGLALTESYDLKMRKKTESDRAGLAKLETAYLKDSLLFEIVTFEEILTYSVSKLEESGHESACAYAERCRELEGKLLRLCSNHKIAVIKPKPHDSFNSAEHEVLTAEKSGDYKKGQIIKLMNSGFKYKEAVLLRANVIAAK